MAGNTFLSYRREDSAGTTGRIYDRLRQTFRSRRLFIDVDNIAPGSDFAKILQAQVSRCDVFLAIIGRHWLSATDDNGSRRLDNPGDFVRIEIASALGRDHVAVIPVLVDGARMPSANDLPEDLRPLVFRNAVEISGMRFHRDLAKLILAIKVALPWWARHERSLARFGWGAAFASTAAATVAGIYGGTIEKAGGLETWLRPSAAEWSRLSYADKSNPMVLRDVIARRGRSPEAEEAQRWLDLLSERAWSRIAAAPTRVQAEDFIRRFPGSPEAADARTALDAMGNVAPAPADAQPLMPFRECTHCPEMVAIPAGSFDMGSYASEGLLQSDNDERPIQRVTVARPFAIGRLEVSVASYAAFVRASGHPTGDSCLGIRFPDAADKRWEFIADQDYLQPGFDQNGDHPVACVNMADIGAYLDWLNTQTKGGYRLPTEVEWEYAARAGSADSFAFGDDEGQLCLHGNGADASLGNNWQRNIWCRDGRRIGTAPGGAYRANAFGLSDMHGNVHEWIADCYHTGYADMPDATRTTGAAWEETNCAKQAIRGGCWAYPADGLRSASREGWEPDRRSFCVGFRVARDLPAR